MSEMILFGSIYLIGVIISAFSQVLLKKSADDTKAESFLKQYLNLKVIGAYDGFSSLPTSKYDLFLYTSLTDGMPNVILEATMAGLPIIASNDGGVGEFIKDKKTGLLIEDYLNYKPYVEAIKWAMRNMDEMKKCVNEAQILLNNRHSFSKFVSIVKKDIG